MKEIKYSDKIYLVIGDTRHCMRGRYWWTKKEDFLQVNTWRLPIGQKIQSEVYETKIDKNNKAMEMLIVLCGRVKCEVYNEDNIKINEIIILPRELAILYRGKYIFEILDNGTNVIEVKNKIC